MRSRRHHQQQQEEQEVLGAGEQQNGSSDEQQHEHHDDDDEGLLETKDFSERCCNSCNNARTRRRRPYYLQLIIIIILLLFVQIILYYYYYHSATAADKDKDASSTTATTTSFGSSAVVVPSDVTAETKKKVKTTARKKKEQRNKDDPSSSSTFGSAVVVQDVIHSTSKTTPSQQQSQPSSVTFTAESVPPPSDPTATGAGDGIDSPTGTTDGFNIDELPLWLKSYVDFHRKGMLMATESGRQDKDNNIYLRWICGDGQVGKKGSCGGTGDRLSGIIQAFYMAICTRRLLLIDWHKPDLLANYLEPNLIMWNITPSLYPLSITGGGGGSAAADIKYPLISAIDKKSDVYHRNPQFMPGPSKPMIEIMTNLYHGHANITKMQCMERYLEQYPTDESIVMNTRTRRDSNTNSTSTTNIIDTMYRYAFWTLFRYNPNVIRHSQQIKRKSQLLILEEEEVKKEAVHITTTTDKVKNETESKPKQQPPFPYVAIHLRTGRDPNLSDKLWKGSGNETDWPLYYQCARAFQRGLIEKCAKYNNDNSSNFMIPPIYLASDTVDAKRQFLEWDSLESDKSIQNTTRAILDMEIYHIDRTDPNKLVNRRRAELNVFAEIKLLIDSTCIVKTPLSKFSRLGDWLQLSANPAAAARQTHRRQQQYRCSAFYNDCGPKVVSNALQHVIANEELCGRL